MKRQTNRYFQKLSVLGLLLSGTLVAAGCGGDVDLESPGISDVSVQTYPLEDTQYTRNIRVFSNVKRLDDRAAMEVSIEPDRLSFPSSVASFLSEYERGDIMATSEGQGLLRRVERIERQGDNLVVFTSGAELGDVFASGEIYYAAHAEPGIQVPESFRSAPVRMQNGDFGTREQALSYDWNQSLFSWNKDFASDINTKIANNYLIVEQASVNFEVGAEFYVDAALKLPPLKTLRVGANGTANATLRIRLQSEDAFDFSKTYYLISTDAADAPMKQIAPKSVSVAGLVKLDFGAKASLKITAKLQGKITATSQVELNGNLAGGIEYKSGKWAPYSGVGFSPSGTGPEFDGDKEFEAQAVLDTELTLKISDTVKGNLIVKPAVVTIDLSQKIYQSGAKKGQCPYHFNINTTGSAAGSIDSIKLPIIGNQSIMKSPSNWTMYNKDFLTLNGQLSLPGICDPNYVVPSFGDGGRYPGMTCTESNQCDGGVVCQRNTCVTEGPIRFTAAWFEDTDIDISVISPSGQEVTWYDFSNPSLDGLKYDFPNCTGKCVGNGSFVESIYSVAAAVPGTYTIKLTHVDDRTEGKGGQVALLIDDNGKLTNEGGQMPAAGESISFEYVVK